ncbi:MAG: hypothetical protein ACI4I5_00870 [Acutalibacteraceae bacterium]
MLYKTSKTNGLRGTALSSPFQKIFSKGLDKLLKKVYYIELYQYKMDNLLIGSRRVCPGARACLRKRKDFKSFSGYLLFGTKIGTE